MLKVITVRLNEASFLAVRNAAFESRVSMNAFCVSALEEAAGDVLKVLSLEDACLEAAASSSAA